MVFSATKGYLTKPKPGVMLNPLHPLSRGLVGYWLFNEGAGSRANDISGHGNHGTLENMSPNVQGSGWGGSKFGGGLEFGGVDDCVDCGNGSSLDFGTGDFSIGAWIKTSSATGKIVAKLASGGWPGFSLEVKGSTIQFEVVGATSGKIINSVVTVTDSAWYHAVGVKQAGNVYVYVDGVPKNSGSGVAGSTDTAGKLQIGRYGEFTTPYYFNGSIDSVRIYNRALAAWEVEQLYDPFCNLLRVPVRYVPAAPPVGAIMNQFQNFNIGADLYNGAIIA